MRQARPREYRQAPGNRPPMKANAIAEPVRALLDPQGRGRPQRVLSLFLAGAMELCDRVVETSLTKERRLP
jgi:hypothetical protein